MEELYRVLGIPRLDPELEAIIDRLATRLSSPDIPLVKAANRTLEESYRKDPELRRLGQEVDEMLKRYHRDPAYREQVDKELEAKLKEHGSS